MRSVVAVNADGVIAGEIRWSTQGGEIALVWVPDHLQRRGIAPALLSEAIRRQPDVHHSSQLTADAQAWIEGLRTYPDPRLLPAPSPVPSASRVALRLTGNHVRTAVWTLAHPATGRTVTLVGTMHIGDATYFRNLSELLAGLAAGGAEIHVEGIARRDGDCLNEWEEDRLAEAGTWDDAETTGAAVKLLSLESQTVHLHLPDGTRNVDLSHVELLRRVGWDDYRRLFASPPEAPATPGFGPVARTAIRFHLPGIARLFTAAGYRLGHEAWSEACVL
jgi:hypothetical protein